jgi:hypothetical protein
VKIASDSGTYLVKLVDYIDNAGSLHWTPDENMPRAKRLATKYLPLVDPFLEWLEKHDLLAHGITDKEPIRQSIIALGERLQLLASE